MPRLAASALVFALAVATPSLVLAQGATDDTARADALFEEGRELSAKGDHAAACAKFEESQKIRPGIGTLFNLADCHEKQGNVVLAYNEYVEVAERTKVALQADREKVARERIAQLEPQIGRIALETPVVAGDLVIQIDGVDIPAEAWKRPIGVPPGEHVVKYGKRGGELKEQKVTAPAGATPVVVDISRESVPAGEPEEEADPAAGGKRNTGLIVTGSILMGVGIISLGVGGYMLENDTSRRGAAIALGVGGLASLGVGIPLFVIGLKKRPVEGGDPAAAQPAAEAWLDAPPPAGVFVRPDVASTTAPLPWNQVEAGPVPAVVVGAGSATAGWRF
jgi:hypothetical protein